MAEPMKEFNSERPRLAFYDRGPGPAGYSLPPLVGKKDHAVTHWISPAWFIGEKLPSILYNLGPGPAYFIPTGLKTNGKFTGFEITIGEKLPMRKYKFFLLR